MYSFSFDAIKNRMVKALQSKTSWANILPYSTNMRLIDIVAEALSEEARYDEYLTREAKWKLAQNRSSLINQSSILRYNPTRKISARGYIRFSASEDAVDSSILDWDEERVYSIDEKTAYNGKIYKALQEHSDVEPGTDPLTWERVSGLTYANNINIPKYTIFSDGDELNVCVMDNYTLLNTDDFVDLQVYQGTPKTEVREALGDNYEEIEILNDSIENDLFSLTVNGFDYTEISDIRLADEDDTVYEISNIEDNSGVILKFGNNIFGKRLDPEDEIIFNFVETDGLEGNITSIGVINTVVSTIYDDQDNVVTCYCINDEVIGGGKDEEDLESIRLNAPLIFQTGDRATSSNDYKAILESFSFVSKAVAWGEYEENIDNGRSPGTYISVEENVVHICAITSAGVDLSTSQQEEIRTFLNDYKSPTDIIKFEEAEIVNMIFESSVKVRDRSNTLTAIRSLVLTALSDEYDINNRNFAESIYESDYIALIDNLDGVEYHDTDIRVFNEKGLDSGYTASGTLSLYAVTPGTVEIYIKDLTDLESEYELIAEDNGGGGFTGIGDYDFSGSSISYEFGSYVLQFTSYDLETENPYYGNFRLKIEYKTDDKNLILKKRSQILKFDSAEIEAVYIL